MIRLLLLVSVLLSGCGSQMSQGAISIAHKEYGKGNYYQVIRKASSGEKRAGVTRIQKAELVYLKALAYENLSRPAEARGLYRYLTIHFTETKFGMMARKKLK